MSLVEKYKTIADIEGKATAWLQQNLEDKEKAKNQIFELKHLKREARNIEGVVGKKPTLGVFGASQVGKSFFMKELFKNSEDNGFYIKFDNNPPIDFIEEINPSRKVEASGIVTRLTINDENSTGYPMPIKLELLKQIDIALILVDSYIADIEDKSSLDEYEYEDISKILKGVSSSIGTQEIDGMSELDIIDFKEYLNNYIDKDKAKVPHLINKFQFWMDLVYLLPRIPYDERYRVFEIFWGKIPIFTELFRVLSKHLHNLNFSQFAFTGTDALMPKAVKGGSVANTILDVGTIMDIFRSEKLQPLSVILEDNQSVKIERGILTMLTKEVELKVDERALENKNRSFLKDIAVLDFPGARTRNNLHVSKLLSIESLNENRFDEDENLLYINLVRGKVSFLFNHYNDKNEITSLLYTQKNSNQEVHELPKMIDKWVRKTHGETSNDRDIAKNNLFIMFTFFNIDLTEEGKREFLGGTWTSRFKENVEEFIGQKLINSNWIEEWESQRKFKNFFFIRDPNRAYSPNFTRDKRGNETGYSDDYIDLMRDKKESFLENEFVQKYLENPSEIWEKSATPNNTGTEYLIEKLSPLTTEERKREQLRYMGQKIKTKMLKILKPHHIGGDIEQDLEEAQERVDDIFEGVDPHYFGNYLDSIILDENLAGTIFYKLKHPTLEEIDKNRQGSLVVNRGRLKDRLFGSRRKGKKSRDKETSSEVDIFYDKLINAFFDELKNRAVSDNILKRVNISLISHEYISKELLDSMLRLGLKKYFKEKMDSYIKDYIANTNLIELISKETTKIINNFILSFGLFYIPLNQREIDSDEYSFYFLEPDYTHRTFSFEELEEKYVKIIEQEEMDLETFYAGETFFIHWLKALEDAFIANVHYKHGGEGIKNIEANNQLGQIILRLEALEE